MFQKYLPIILVTFVNVIGFTLLIPVMPGIVQQYAPVQYTGALYGGLMSTYAIFQFLGAPVLGSFSDKYGRRPLLFISQLGTTLSWVIFMIAYFTPDIRFAGVGLPLIVIAISRVTDGITGGNISVANAWISDHTAPEEKTKIFGLIGAVFGIGFLFGPTLGGLASTTSLGYLGTLIVAFLISLVTLAMVYFYLPESLSEEKRDKELHIHVLNEINVWKNIRKFKESLLVQRLIFLRVIFALVFASYVTIIILFLQRQFQLSEVGLGLVLSAIGLFSILNQAVLTHQIAKKLGDINTLYLSYACIFIGLIVLPFLPTELHWSGVNISLFLFMANSYLMNLGISLGQPTFKTLLTNSVSEKKQGMITGLDESLLALGNALSPVIAGSLYTLIGPWTFVVFAILMVLPHLAFYLLPGPNLLEAEVHHSQL